MVDCCCGIGTNFSREPPQKDYVSMEALHRQFKAVSFDVNLLPINNRAEQQKKVQRFRYRCGSV